jgi:calcyphosin
MDDDGSKSISLPEFAKACRDFKVGVSDDNVPILFEQFDTNRDGTLNIDEFLMAIRGELNQFRANLVEKAFRKIDKDSNGSLEIDDIKDIYNASKHPDVL